MTVTVADRRDERVSQSFAVRVSGPALVPLFPRAAAMTREGFLRVINHESEAIEVLIAATDDYGMTAEPVILSLAANSVAQFNSTDLEEGNPAKGLSGGTGPGQGDWRLVLESDADFEVLAYIRTEDGFLTTMHDVLQPVEGVFPVPIFNPASNLNQVSRLRLVNAGNEDAQVRITGTDDLGMTPDSVMRLTIPARHALTVSASDLESGHGEEDGSLGDGTGKWQLQVAADDPIVVMNLLESPYGHLTNLSVVPPRHFKGKDAVQYVYLLPAAGDALGRQGFVRVIDRSGAGGTVTILAQDDSEAAYEPRTLAIDAGSAVHFSSDDLELGNEEKGLEGSTGAGVGDWLLTISSGRDIEVLAYIRTADGFLTAMNAVSPAVLGEVWVPTFNPANNPDQVSALRLVNLSEGTAEVSIVGVDDTGASQGNPAMVTIPAGEVRCLTAIDLEGEGALGDGTGKWRLRVTSDQSIVVMSLLESPTGHLTNLSTAPDRGGAR